MKTVIVVDDEILMRVGIKSIADWEKYGYQIAGEAADGEAAFELMKKCHPDIVLTDLVMAPKDGFWLIEHGRKHFPKTVFIVLSSYNDMDNVRRALKLGAVDYLFKLRITVDSLVETLNEAVPAQEEGKEEENQIWENILDIKESYLKNIMENPVPNRSCTEQARAKLALETDFEKSFVLFRVSIDDYCLRITQPDVSDVNLLKSAVLNIIMEVLRPGERADGYTYGLDFVMAVQTEEGTVEKERLREKFQKIQECVRRYAGMDISGCISDSFCGEGQVRQAFAQTEKMLRRRIARGSGHFYTTDDLTERKKGNLKLPFEGLIYEIEIVMSRDGKALMAYLDKYFKKISHQEGASEMEIRKYYMELYYGLNKNAELYCLDLNQFTDDYGNDLYTVVVKGDTSSQIQAGFRSVIRKFIQALGNADTTQPREDIKKAKRYIRNNLSSELTVPYISEMLGINSSYFSHIFKKETGFGFVDYVNKARIAKAKELLLKTDYPVYEIARMVGIENPTYFSSLFKKITGQNPRNIREGKKG